MKENETQHYKTKNPEASLKTSNLRYPRFEPWIKLEAYHLQRSHKAKSSYKSTLKVEIKYN
jgi:hypothetical protein